MATKRNDKGTGRYQWTDDLLKENIKRFHEFKSKGTLGNNGPKMPGSATLFSPDRWKAMLEDMAKNAPKKAKQFTDATNMKVGQSTKEASVEKDFEEFVVDKNELKITDVVDKLPTQGMLSPTDDGTVMPADGSFLSKERAQKTRDANVSAIKAKYAKQNFDRLDAEIQRKRDKEEAERRRVAQGKISGVKDKLSDILTNYSSVDKLEAQKAKAVEVAAKKQEELKSKMMDNEIVDITKQFVDLDEEYSNDRLEAELKGASGAQDKMEAAADIRDNPMMNLSDKEKGDFEFKALEPKDKSGTAGISMIISETGLDAKKATELFGKLKGLCN
jgi:hypothetical protein